jgi:hypothetical protein
MMHRGLQAVVALAAAAVPVSATAYVDVELANGRHVIGESAQTQGTKLVVYRPSGNLEVDQATVRSIQERSGTMPAEPAGPKSGSETPEADSSAPSSPTGHRPPATAKDAAAREREITNKLFEVYRYRLAAMNREDKAAFEKLDKESKQLENERGSLRKQRAQQKKEHP